MQVKDQLKRLLSPVPLTTATTRNEKWKKESIEKTNSILEEKKIIEGSGER